MFVKLYSWNNSGDWGPANTYLKGPQAIHVLASPGV